MVKKSRANYLRTGDSLRFEKDLSVKMDVQDRLPAYVQRTLIPDSLQIDADKIIYGDFNADGKEDFASIVTNLENGF